MVLLLGDVTQGAEGSGARVGYQNIDAACVFAYGLEQRFEVGGISDVGSDSGNVAV